MQYEDFYRRSIEQPEEFWGEQARAILKENAEPPDGKWGDLAVLVPVREFKARHASTMLTFDAVVDAIGQIEAKRTGQETHQPAGTPASS